MSAEKSCFPFHQWDGCRCARCGKQRNTGHIYRWEKGSVKRRNANGWVETVEGCGQRCVKCRAARPGSFSAHDMQMVGCRPTCKRCGTTGEPQHRWVPVEGKCVERCSCCGTERSIPHRMQPRVRDGHCERVCTRCGAVEEGHRLRFRRQNGRCEQYCIYCGYAEEKHEWGSVLVERKTADGRSVRDSADGCKCRLCGALNPQGAHDWNYIETDLYTGIRECRRCGKRDESQKRELTADEKAYRETMIEMDSLHDMRAAGWKV